MIRARLLRLASAVALAAAAMVPLGAVLAGPASADTFTVTNGNNDGAGSLRAALAALAGTDSNPDMIDIQAGVGTITVTSELSIDANGALTINGNGATLTGPGVGRGFVDEGGEALTINELTITGFGGSASANAAAVYSIGPITLNSCSITANAIASDSEDVAGGVLSEGGQINITDCTITGNSATASDGDAGGGVLSEGGPVVIVTSTISGNSASSSFGDAGGGVLSEGGSEGPVTVRDSTFNCNTATTTGDGGDAAGAILSEGGTITINGSTVVGNTATAVGDSQNALLPTTVDGTGNTISDDTTACAAPPTPPPTTTTPTPAPAAQPVQAVAKFTG